MMGGRERGSEGRSITGNIRQETDKNNITQRKHLALFLSNSHNHQIYFYLAWANIFFVCHFLRRLSMLLLVHVRARPTFLSTTALLCYEIQNMPTFMYTPPPHPHTHSFI